MPIKKVGDTPHTKAQKKAAEKVAENLEAARKDVIFGKDEEK